jgi:predicted DCC family thiol-disulfide oxidoreductase YuxK
MSAKRSTAPLPPAEPTARARPRATLLYDGECPFCSRYADWVRLRQRYDIELLDARGQLERVRELAGRGYDINRGMILLLEDRVYHGADAILVLRGMTAPIGGLDRAAAAIARVPGLVRLFYPLIKVVRRMTLWAMGRQPDIRT